MLIGTVEYNALAGSSPAISASSRDVAEWQTRHKMHLVLWAGSEIWYHISFAPRSSGFESPRVHHLFMKLVAMKSIQANLDLI